MINLIQLRHHRAEKVAWFLQVVPFVRFVGLTGSLAYDTAKKDSDIDLFIITKYKRIWTCRFFAVALLTVFGLYRTGNLPKQRAGKFCLNRYVTDEYLLVNPQNRYHAQDYTQMLPLFDHGLVYKNFLKKNQWMEKYGYYPPRRAIALIQSAGVLSTIRIILEWILSRTLGDWFEARVKSFQLKSIMKDNRVNRPGSGLFVDDNELRFHPNPR